jgi:hypothetical protein
MNNKTMRFLLDLCAVASFGWIVGFSIGHFIKVLI